MKIIVKLPIFIITFATRKMIIIKQPMKIYSIKKFAILMLLLVLSINLLAIPANPKQITIKQPNGKSLTLTLKGDEKVNWASTIDSYTLVRNSESVLVYGQLNERGDLTPSIYIASNQEERSAEEKGLFFQPYLMTFVLAIIKLTINYLHSIQKKLIIK